MSETIRQDSRLDIRINSHVYEMIKERAKEENMTVSDYLRYAVMLDCVFSGKSEAYKMLASSFSRVFMEWFGGRVREISRLRLEKVD